MEITYDYEADALSIISKKSNVVKTIKMKDRLLVDIDKDGSVVGIEVLDASAQMPKRNITEFSFKMPSLANFNCVAN